MWLAGNLMFIEIGVMSGILDLEHPWDRWMGAVWCSEISFCHGVVPLQMEKIQILALC